MFEKKIELTENIVKEIFTNFYNLGDILSITQLESGHESDNVKIVTDMGDYVLKLFCYPQIDYIRNLMKIYELLNEYGIKVPSPLKTQNNEFVSKYNENNILVLLTFIPGEPIYRDNKPLMFKWMKWFGKQFGILHNKSKQITLDKYEQIVGEYDLEKYSLPPGSWVMDRYNERDTLLPEHEKNEEILDCFEKFLKIIAESRFSDLTKGIVHEDMMPGNFFKKGEELMGILDFGATYSYLMADIGTWIFYTGLYKPELRENYIDFILPYLEYSKIPIDELKNITLFLKSRAYVQYFYFAFRVTNKIAQGFDDDEDPIKENWKEFKETIPFIELVNSIDDNYFYDLVVQAKRKNN